jgi:rhodanese-related sulfurtransferase
MIMGTLSVRSTSEYYTPLGISHHVGRITVLNAHLNNIEYVPAHNWETWRDENDAVVIDVREPVEWTSGTLPDSVTISLTSLPAAASTMDKDTAVLLVCATGARSVTAAAWLASMGFETVASMAGGVVALGYR